MKKTTIVYTLLLILSACAHHPDVRPSEDGIHKILLMVEDKNNGGREALDQAKSYCKEINLQPVIVSEKTNYVGNMDEQTYNKVKTGAKVAEAAGGAVHVFGGEKESKAGGVIGLGGIVADSAAGEGYQYEMKFKCK